jgi:predicted DNA-binding WGR domain protein
MWTILKRVDLEDHINRWYAVGVQTGLFDAVAVVRFWGSRETAYQQVRVEPFGDQVTARIAADRLIQKKLRRGYQYVTCYVPDEGGVAGLHITEIDKAVI